MGHRMESRCIHTGVSNIWLMSQIQPRCCSVCWITNSWETGLGDMACHENQGPWALMDIAVSSKEEMSRGMRAQPVAT